jgi:phage shock protein PspC (stress-responsive transcriptional regulator)
MRRVITVSLNGNAYALEEDAADALSAYLDRARAALSAHMDVDEILSDLEQAIADKSQRYLGAHKTVITRAEMEAVLAEMGPVETGDGGAQPHPSSPSAANAPGRRRRLYRIRQGQKIGGVCTGIAAYFGLDVSWVRLAFLALAFFWGVPLFLYIALVIVLPVARTPEELAAATGAPFNARDFVDRARQETAELRNHDWKAEKDALKAEWQQSTSHMRRELRESLRSWRQRRMESRRRREMAQPAAPDTRPPNRRRSNGLADLVAALLMVPLVLIFAGLAIAWIVLTVTLVTTGAVFGLLWPVTIPIWMAVLLLWIAFAILTWPLRLLQQMLFQGSANNGISTVFTVLESLVTLTVFALLGVWCYHHVPAIGHLIDHVLNQLNLVLERWSDHSTDINV